MSYDGDDPDGLLGRPSRQNSPSLPGGPFRAKGLVRGLTGDVRVATKAGESFQIIDIEYDLPRVLMIQGRVLPQPSAPPMPNIGYPAFAEWKLSTGLDRSPLVNQRLFKSSRFSLTVVARSVQMVVKSLPPPEDDPFSFALPYTIQALVTPMEVSCDVGNLNALNTSLASQAPNRGFVFSTTPATGGPQTIDHRLDVEGADPLIFGQGIRRGFSVYNDTTVNVLLVLGDVNGGNWSVRMVVGSYFEAPYNYSGKLTYFYEVGGGTGNLRFTAFGAAPQG